MVRAGYYYAVTHTAYIQTRSVLSAQPVAIHVPNGFHAIERMLYLILASEHIYIYIYIYVRVRAGAHVRAAAAHTIASQNLLVDGFACVRIVINGWL